MRELRWINSYYALIIPAMFSAYGTFLLRQFFLQYPDRPGGRGGDRRLLLIRHLSECNSPALKPALSALAILTFIGSWRSFIWPLIVTHEKEMFTLPVALASFQEMFTVQWTLLMARAP